MEQLEQEDLDGIIKEQTKDNKKGESSLQIKEDGVTIESLLVRFDSPIQDVFSLMSSSRHLNMDKSGFLYSFA